jgi:hypothetical protein
MRLKQKRIGEGDWGGLISVLIALFIFLYALFGRK